jgi:hypothetical protein
MAIQKIARAVRGRTAEPSGAAEMAAELRLMASQLHEAVDNVILAEVLEDQDYHYSAFTGALSILMDVRSRLSREASKLEAVRS